MDVASLIISSLSLIAVLIIGWRTIMSGERSAKASEESAEASVLAAQATERSVVAAESAAKATERSVAASERAAALAASDACYRRIVATLAVVLEMREAFNDQHAAHESEEPPWVPPTHSPEALQRLALMRTLEGRLVGIDRLVEPTTASRTLITTYLWTSGTLELAITEMKELLKSQVDNGAAS